MRISDWSSDVCSSDLTAQDAIHKACVGSKSARPHYSADRGGRAIALPASPFSQREREESALSGCHAHRAATLSPLIIAFLLAACGNSQPVADAAAGHGVCTAETWCAGAAKAVITPSQEQIDGIPESRLCRTE